jgi:TorA maturation chaperone TorD
MKNHEQAHNASQRANLYGFLATLYRAEPDSELIHRLADADYLALLRAAGADLDAAYFQRPEAEVLEELAIEYTRLFIGPGKHVSPHASANMPDEGGTLWGRSTTDAVARIREAGLDYDPDYHGLPDHISVEFELMAALAGREAEAWRAGEEAAALSQREFQASFVEEHLRHWLPEFCRRIIERAELPLFGEMAKLTAAFLEAERADLATESDVG